MSDDLMQDPRLAAVLDTIVPARGGIEGAGGLGLAGSVLADAQANDTVADLIAVLDALPSQFASLDAGARESALRAIEATDPESVASVVNMVYTAYYTQPHVLAGISERTGYNPGPPQPSGYVLDSFDPTLLEPVRERSPLWRPDDI